MIDIVSRTLPVNTKFVNNGICHLFEDARLELNGIEIDRCKNVGLSTLMNWVALNPNQLTIMQNAGWFGLSEEREIVNDQGYFDVFIPLSMILGFAEDYKKIVVNVKLELILTRSRDDLNAVLQDGTVANNLTVYDKFKIELTKIEWLMPYVQVSDSRKISLFKFLEKDRPITMSFRSKEFFEYPLLPVTPKHIWVVKTSNQLEKPRFIIVGLQTQRKFIKNADASRFDNCDITNVKLFLNSQYYPYSNLNLNIAQNQYAALYDMYANFQSAYYGKDPEPLLTRSDFIQKIPLVVIDCSKQNESLKHAPVDVRLELESRNNFPVNTAAYCLSYTTELSSTTPLVEK